MLNSTIIQPISVGTNCCELSNESSPRVECFANGERKDRLEEVIMMWAMKNLIWKLYPNDIIGPKGYRELQWISHDELLDYTICFENDLDFQLSI